MFDDPNSGKPSDDTVPISDEAAEEVEEDLQEGADKINDARDEAEEGK